MEVWILVALGAATLKTGYSALQKRLTFEYDGLELSYLTAVLGCAFTLPLGVWRYLAGDVTLTPTVLGVVLLSGAVNVAALFAFLGALDAQDLSVAGPLTQSTPVFVALTEPFVLAAAVGWEVVVGAVAAVLGGYVLVADEGLGTPVERVAGRPALLAITAAALYAVTSLANRFVTTRVPPLFYAFLVYALMALGFAAIRTVRSQDLLPPSLVRRPTLALGGVTALRTTVTYYAFSLAIASKVSVVLQASVLMNVVAGGVLFAEEGLARKLAGALLVVVGILLTL